MFKCHKKTKKDQKNIRIRNYHISKFFLILSFLLIIWIIFVLIGISLLGLTPDWTYLNLEYWIYLWLIITITFIIIDIIIYFRLDVSVDVFPESDEGSNLEYIHGKRIYVYTFPTGIKGGIFSKTYIKIDEDNVLRLRTIMIHPGDLWDKK